MCGLLAVFQPDYNQINYADFKAALQKQEFRGPDFSDVKTFSDGQCLLGHNRLIIRDKSERSNQPVLSADGRYALVYNGEIYNCRELKELFNLRAESGSDTLIMLEGLIKFGENFIRALDGMFAFFFYDVVTKSFLAARDPIGIKPLYYRQLGKGVIFSSEVVSITSLVGGITDAESFREWEHFRRPCPGATFFEGITEVLPGHLWKNSGMSQFWKRSKCYDSVSLHSEVMSSISSHLVSDAPVCSFFSSGLDSAVISRVSGVPVGYCIGMTDSNEFSAARKSSAETKVDFVEIEVYENAILDAWDFLTRLKGEPLYVPNEALLYLGCKSFSHDEKVVLTGEGADELFWGYDGLFKAANVAERCGLTGSDFVFKFLEMYSYGKDPFLWEYCPRVTGFCVALSHDKSPLEFLEDFLFEFHLPGLLRRMDFCTMAAGIEARVPYCTKRLAEKLFRPNYKDRIRGTDTKLPLRKMARRLHLKSAAASKKISFNAEGGRTRQQHYEMFRRVVRGALK